MTTTKEVMDKILRSLCSENEFTPTESNHIALGWIAGRHGMIKWSEKFNYVCITPLCVFAAVYRWNKDDLAEYYAEFTADIIKRLPKDYHYKFTEVVEGSCIVFEIYDNEDIDE